MNYLLDTNVVSEIRKVRSGRADDNVAAWARRQSDLQLYISAMTVYEIERGVLAVERSDPRQARTLRNWLEMGVLNAFHGRILEIYAAIAMRCAKVRAQRTCEIGDGMIAATALENRMIVVTRNVEHFEPLGLRVVNPWLS